MNRVWSLILTLVFAVTMSGCNETEDDNLDQRDDIISYLESSHSPKLISESAVAESLDSEPAFYSTTGLTTFRYIEDYYNTEREEKTTIKKGSKIEIVISVYDFTSMTTPSTSTILYSNDPVMVEELILIADWFTGEAWSTEPLSMTVGNGNLFSGVETLLVGCKEGDVVEFYLTFNEAYGSSIIGIATEYAPLALYCEILTVNN